MPLYEYTCEKCQSAVELLIRGDECPECPECGSRKLERRLSAPFAHSRGAGSLPMRSEGPMPGGCGRPQCGMGGCQGFDG